MRRKCTRRCGWDFEERTVGEGILDFDYVTVDEFGGTFKGFTGVGMGEYGYLGYFNARADWNIDIMRGAHTPPSTKQNEKWLWLRRVYSHSRSEYAPTRDIVHHRNPTSASFQSPERNFWGVGSGMTAFQTR